MQAEQFMVASCLLEALLTLQPMVRKQKPKGHINWSPEVAIFSSNFELIFQLYIYTISVQCARGTLTVQPEQFVVASCLLKALLTLQQRLESKDIKGK